MATLNIFKLMTLSIIVIVAATIIEANLVSIRSIITRKDDRCHNPFINKATGEFIPSRLSYTIYENQGERFKLVAWFYQKLYKSCSPLYSVNGVHHDNNTLDLPRSKEECDDICGEPCRMDDGTNGVCMTESYCDIKTKRTYYSARPCSVYQFNINCCPRNYSSRPIPTI